MTQRKTEQAVICQICKKPKKLSEVLSAELIREPIVKEIQKVYPD